MLIEDAVVGVTSNPTIFQKALAEGDAYDEQLREVLPQTEDDPNKAFFELAIRDVGRMPATCSSRWVLDEGSGRDGYVSLEVDPNLGRMNTEGHVIAQACANHLHAAGRPQEPAREDPGDQGGPRGDRGPDLQGPQHQRHADLRPRAPRRGRGGLHPRARAARRGRRGPGRRSRRSRRSSSRASTPRSTTASRRSAATTMRCRGKAAIANAKLAYEQYLEVFSGDRWEALAAKGATPQRCLWASTSTKNPNYRDVVYVEELIGSDTVDTMPQQEPSRTFPGPRRGCAARPCARAGRGAKGKRRPEGAGRGRDRHGRRLPTRWSARAWRSSPIPSRSCSPTSSPSATSWWRHERARPAAARRLGPLLLGGQLRPPHVLAFCGRFDGCPCGPNTWRYQVDKPKDPHNDHLIFSKGRASPLYYAILKAIGAVDRSRADDIPSAEVSRLEGHPTPVLPWVDVATGSLGQGLPIRGRYRARRQAARSSALSDLDPVRRLRDGRGLHVGGDR